MRKARRAKTFLLVAASTILGPLVGIEVAGYLTVPRIAMTSEGDGLAVFDPELGAAPRSSGHTTRIYPAIKDRKTHVYDIYTNERGARVDGPGERSPAHADIVAIGCSFTWGHAVANTDTYTSRLARELNVVTANFAMAAFGTVQSLQMLKRNRDLAPKLVVYGIIAAHLDRNVAPCAPSYYPFCLDVSHVAWDRRGQPEIAPPLSNGVRRFEQHLTGDFSDPVSWLTHGLDVVFGRSYFGWSLLNEPDDAKKEEALSFLLRELDRTVSEMGSQLLVVYMPTNYWAAPEALPRVIGQIGGKIEAARPDRPVSAPQRHKEAGGEAPTSWATATRARPGMRSLPTRAPDTSAARGCSVRPRRATACDCRQNSPLV